MLSYLDYKSLSQSSENPSRDDDFRRVTSMHSLCHDGFASAETILP